MEQKVCDATPFLDGEPVDERSIKVGDAAITIDPISSQGVQTAIGTALHAAAVIHTILDRPHDRALAMDFYRRRLSHSAEFHSGAAAGFYREQFEACATEFWCARAKADPRSTSKPHRRNTTPPTPCARVQISPRVRLVDLAVSDGCHIFPEEAVELDGNAVVFIAAMKLRDLLQSARHPVPVPELIGRWATKMPPEVAHQVFHWAWAEEWIEAVDQRRC
jgi:hypothetical protein